MRTHFEFRWFVWMRAWFTAALLMVGTPSWSTCWPIDWVIARAEQIAAQRFPDLQGAMPRVVVCQAFDFPNRAIGGRFSSGPVPTIEIPEYSLSNDLNDILAHELGHAEASRRGMDDGTLQGHGVGWMRVMIEAGLEAEAQRVVGYMPHAKNAFQMARSQVHGPTVEQWPPPVGGGQGVGPQSGPTGYTLCFVQQQYWLIEGRYRRLVTQWVPTRCPR